jgi:hypothetical protein
MSPPFPRPRARSLTCISSPAFLFVLAASLAVAPTGCATSDESGKPVTYSLTAKQNYEKGLAELKNEDYAEAAKYFQFVKQKYPFSKYAVLQAGLSIGHATFQSLTARVAVEGRATNGRSPILAVGGELDSAVGAAVRFGYRAGDDVASWSTGVGWTTRGLRIDYAFVPSKLELDDTHRFSLTAQF